METREKNTKERILEEALQKQAGDIRKYCRTNESDGCRKSKKI